jgi:phosphate starvation-inducible PhoH-like protein
MTQIDLPNPKKSGLFEALQVLEGVEGIRFCHFEEVDVVRHHLVQRIVRAYDSYGRAQQLPLELGDAELVDAAAETAAVPKVAIKAVSKPQ